MKIRRIQYDIEFTHILTFQDEYRKKIAPIFKEPNLRYGLENIGTLDESIKLIFTDLNFVIHCSKGAIRIMMEGDPKEFTKGGSPQWDIFQEIFNSIKEIEGFGHLTRHIMQAQSVRIFENNDTPCELSESSINTSKYLKFTPFKKSNEFAIVFENGKDENTSKVTFGNFNESDISKFDLTPFKTEYNNDLSSNQGYIADIVVKKQLTSFSKSSFKSLLADVESLVKQFEN